MISRRQPAAEPKPRPLPLRSNSHLFNTHRYQFANASCTVPEAKGLVERFHDYIERAFLPGRVFSPPADFNTQLQDWLVRTNYRQHRSCSGVARLTGSWPPVFR